MTAETALICVRVVDLPRPSVSSIGDRCASCAAPVWRSALSETLEPRPRIVCIPCALVELADAPGEITPAPYVDDDLEQLARRRRLS